VVAVSFAVLVDVSRLAVYTQSLAQVQAAADFPLLAAAVASAFLGALAGNRFLRHVTMPGIQRLVAALLFFAALGLMLGVL
jgi:uncharacterized membrane protein YfcA